MVVDDTLTVRKLMEKLLLKMGFARVDCYENGSKGLDAMMAGQVDIVFSDVQMPIMTGPEVSLVFTPFSGCFHIISDQFGLRFSADGDAVPCLGERCPGVRGENQAAAGGGSHGERLAASRGRRRSRVRYGVREAYRRAGRATRRAGACVLNSLVLRCEEEWDVSTILAQDYHGS
jgi:hypothetical protein